MTSPVDFISGPSRASALGKRLNGSTASFTDTCRAGRAVEVHVRQRSPSIRRHAILASGTPWPSTRTAPCARPRVRLDHVQLVASPWTANWMLIGPSTPSA